MFFLLGGGVLRFSVLCDICVLFVVLLFVLVLLFRCVILFYCLLVLCGRSVRFCVERDSCFLFVLWFACFAVSVCCCAFVGDFCVSLFCVIVRAVCCSVAVCVISYFSLCHLLLLSSCFVWSFCAFLC